MNILIHGFTQVANFGDVLFAHIFCRELSNYGKVGFLDQKGVGIDPILVKEIQYDKTVNIDNADIFVYMSGGYFGDTTRKLKEVIFRYRNYFRIAGICKKNRIPIVICGVSGGPLHNIILRKIIVDVLNSAKRITVRDIESKEYFEKYGVSQDITVTTDTALALSYPEYSSYQEETSVIGKIKQKANGKKLLFFHIYPTDKANLKIYEVILPALNRFIKSHPDEFLVVVGADKITSVDTIENTRIFQDLEADKVAFAYRDTKEMCGMLYAVDCTITVKFHVGIVACVYGKSVISFPIHPSKTQRFYRQIGCEERSVLLENIGVDEAYKLIEKYYSLPVSIPNEILNKAKQNYDKEFFNFI